MFLDNFISKVKLTKDSRFQAFARMRRLNVASNVSLSVLSACIISINLLAFIVKDSFTNQFITVFTIGLSVFALVLSLLISMQAYAVKADNYHRCGCELAELLDRAEIWKEENINLSLDNKEKLQKGYHSIIKNCNLNHTYKDYAMSVVKCGEERSRHISKSFTYILWYGLDMMNFYILLSIGAVLGTGYSFYVLIRYMSDLC